MDIINVQIEVIILCSVICLTQNMPFNKDNKLHCADSNEGIDYGRDYANYYYKPHSKLQDMEKYPIKSLEFDKKRSIFNELDVDTETDNPLQKRQVGVVYKDDNPIGILQPFQRSYRFIPVRDDTFNGITEEVAYNLPGLTDVDKREVSSLDMDNQFDEYYPSILTNFKIDNKLDKKRNYDAFTDENVRDLKATIRRLRSSNSRNNEQIEEQLKNILDDMGLMEDEEIHEGKREISEEKTTDENLILTENERHKRYDSCINSGNSDVANQDSSEHTFFGSSDKKNQIKSDVFNQEMNKRESIHDTTESYRKKRQEQGFPLETEMAKESTNEIPAKNKWPLASNSEIAVRETDDTQLNNGNENEDDRIERQIQSKINSLKEEVKREIEALKSSDYEDEEENDIQRKKRQVMNNLINEETNELDPVLDPNSEIKPLIRKRREAEVKARRKRDTDFFFDNRLKTKSDHFNDVKNKRNYQAPQEEKDEDGDLLGDEDFEQETISKRQIYSIDQNYDNFDLENSNDKLYERDKRSGTDLYDDYFYNDKYFFDNNNRMERDNFQKNQIFGADDIQNQFMPSKKGQYKLRMRRRINANSLIPNRPQQLSDMSDVDLFGALPKSYNGELSRYKRVKRK